MLFEKHAPGHPCRPEVQPPWTHGVNHKSLQVGPKITKCTYEASQGSNVIARILHKYKFIG